MKSVISHKLAFSFKIVLLLPLSFSMVVGNPHEAVGVERGEGDCDGGVG